MMHERLKITVACFLANFKIVNSLLTSVPGDSCKVNLNAGHIHTVLCSELSIGSA